MVKKSTAIIPLSSARKNHEINMMIQESLRNEKVKKENNVLLEDAQLMNDQARIDKSINLGFERKNLSRVSEIIKMDEVFNKNFDVVMKNIFATVAYEALPIDSEVKEKDAENIYEEAGNVYSKLSEAEMLTITGSPLFKQFSGSAVKYIEGFKNELTKDQIIDAVKTVYAENRTDLQYLIRNIYAKTASVVRTEKELVAFNNQEDNIKVRANRAYVRESLNNTLFRAINESHISNLTEEGLSKEGILDAAIAESLFTYTMLETLHTSKLIKVDIHKLNKLSNIL